jgi:hypothetical protein
MNLYYYCSYDGSPVGFRIGRIDALSRDEKIELSSEKIEPFIRRCFETGLVRSAFGKIPSDADSEKKFFLLKKKLIGKKATEKKADCKYYMSVAVVEEEWDKFCSLLQDGADEASLATAVMRSIEPSGENAFGYKVDTQELSKVLECGFASVCNCNETRINNVQKNDAFYATLSTETPDTDALKKSLGIVQGSSTHTEITKESGKVFCFGKKKSASTRNVKLGVDQAKLPVLAKIALVVGVLSMIIWGIATIVTLINKKENLNPDMKRTDAGKKKIEVPDGIDAEALMKVLNNPEMAALLAGLAKGVIV